MKTTLNRKQQRFALEYIKDFNATQAAIRAGYSPKSANSQGTQLVKNPSINKYIDEVLTQAKDNITEEWVINELLSNYKRVKEEKNEQYVEKYHTNIMKYKQLLTDKQVIETADVADFLKSEISKAANKPAESNDNMSDNKEKIEESAETVKNDNN